MQMYRVRLPFVAVRPSAEGAFESVALPPGSIISVKAERTVLRSGLVDVLYDGKILAAYLRDIEDRAESVDAQAN
jgi:hypothetical protein